MAETSLCARTSAPEVALVRDIPFCIYFFRGHDNSGGLNTNVIVCWVELHFRLNLAPQNRNKNPPDDCVRISDKTPKLSDKRTFPRRCLYNPRIYIIFISSALFSVSHLFSKLLRSFESYAVWF